LKILFFWDLTRQHRLIESRRSELIYFLLLLETRLMDGNRNRLILKAGIRLLTNAVSNPVRTETSAWCFCVHTVGRQNWISEKEPKAKQGTKKLTNFVSSKVTQRKSQTCRGGTLSGQQGNLSTINIYRNTNGLTRDRQLILYLLRKNLNVMKFIHIILSSVSVEHLQMIKYL
jgi:hypothetical protein